MDSPGAATLPRPPVRRPASDPAPGRDALVHGRPGQLSMAQQVARYHYERTHIIEM